MNPGIGRIVHYVGGSKVTPVHRPAMIIDVKPGTFLVTLAVFNPTATFFTDSVGPDETEKKVGTWHWPERE